MATLLQSNHLKYLIRILQEKLTPVLTRLKEGEAGYNINIKLKSFKLTRQIAKFCNMFSFDHI